MLVRQGLIIQLAFSLWLLLNDGVEAGTVKVTRSAAPGIVTNETHSGSNSSGLSTNPLCRFEGELRFGQPISLKSTDRFFATSQLCLIALGLVVDYINSQLCGVRINNKNYSVTLESYGDESSPNVTQAIGDAIVGQVDFLLAGYSSSLTAALAPVAQANKRLLIAGGSSHPDVFQNRSFVFGTLPDSFLGLSIEGLARVGAKSVAYVQEDQLGSCDSVPALARSYKLDLLSQTQVSVAPTLKTFLPVAEKMKIAQPDIMVTCVNELSCADWIKAMREVDWSPKAQVFTICIGSSSFEEGVGTDTAYIMGATPWFRSMPVRDAVTGWSAEEFANIFESTSSLNATYQAAATGAALGIFVQAIENVNSIAQTAVMEQLKTKHFMTFYGNISFDENGQSSAPSSLLQYDSQGVVRTVYPATQRTADIFYPMPTWRQRDCSVLGSCLQRGGTCQADGVCACPRVGEISLGVGAGARCEVPTEEDMTYISHSLILVGAVFVVLQGALSLAAIIWIILFRKRMIVRVSQPVFLVWIAVGCLILSLSIIPMSRQAAYRYLKNPSTGGFTDQINKAARGTDMACMAQPWLYGIGFAITFSALLAKVWRVKMLFTARGFARKTVKLKDVAAIMVIIMGMELGILVAWQLVSPFRWVRVVLIRDSNGLALKSVGSCRSDYGWWFMLALVLFNIACLMFALYLSFVTRKISSKFAESKWIAAAIVSMLQIMALAIPTLILVMNNTDGFYFVRACVMFLLSFTVMVLIFGPKFYDCHFLSERETRDSIQEGIRSSTGSSRLAKEKDSTKISLRDESRLSFQDASRNSLGSKRDLLSEISNSGIGTHDDCPSTVRNSSLRSSSGTGVQFNIKPDRRRAVMFEDGHDLRIERPSLPMRYNVHDYEIHQPIPPALSTNHNGIGRDDSPVRNSDASGDTSVDSPCSLSIRKMDSIDSVGSTVVLARGSIQLPLNAEGELSITVEQVKRDAEHNNAA